LARSLSFEANAYVLRLELRMLAEKVSERGTVERIAEVGAHIAREGAAINGVEDAGACEALVGQVRCVEFRECATAELRVLADNAPDRGLVEIGVGTTFGAALAAAGGASPGSEIKLAGRGSSLGALTVRRGCLKRAPDQLAQISEEGGAAVLRQARKGAAIGWHSERGACIISHEQCGGI
jgi:hypothetical protein